jgi:hypothetical protein
MRLSKHAGSVGIFVVSAAVGMGLVPRTAAAQSNPIVIENQQPGSIAWQIPFGQTGSDAVGQIRGYGSAPSINKGESITFNVSVNPAQTYTIDVYRMGWYQGLGGRLMQHVGPLTGTPQATCPTDPTTGIIECKWAPAYTLATQTSWTSGIYMAVLTNAQAFQSYIVFAVRDDSRVAALLYQQAVTTYQAYNDYPYDSATGKSLYAFNSYGKKTVSGGPNAVKVSFDRPYEFDGAGGAWSQSFLSWEYSYVRWLEKSGYDVTYSTDLDTHTNGARLLNYRGVLSVGHDEYFSKQMYDAFVAARDAGVNIGFFGADAVGWQVRLEPSSTGVANRVLVCYRDATIDPNPDPTLKTIEWSDPGLNRPEQTLVGVQYQATVPWHGNGWAPYVVTNNSSWVYAGTGFNNGDSLPGIVGYEADRFFSGVAVPPSVSGTYTLVSQSPLGNGGSSDYSNASIYQAPSGAWVFAAGTTGWGFGLDNYNGYNLADPRLQLMTANILNRFVNPANNFSVAASPASQTVIQGAGTSYGVTISPTGTFTGQVTLSVSGLPGGAAGTFAPNPATASSTLSVTTIASTPPGTYTLTITGISGTLAHTTTVSLVVNVPPDFSLSALPVGQSVGQGGAANYGVTINRTGGLASSIALGVSGLPIGAIGIFSPNPATSTSSTLAVATTVLTPVGTYTLTITGTAGTLVHVTTVSLTVSPPDFSLRASPASASVTQGGATSYGVTVTPVAGFTGQVTLSVSGLPSGASGSFSPNPTTATTPGTFTVTITGVSGNLTHTTTVSFTVSRLGIAFDNSVTSGFQWSVTSASTPAFTIGANANRAAMIQVAMSANNATGITASLGGVAGTLVPGTDSGTTASIRTMIFQVINPPSGSQTATVSWTTAMHAVVSVMTVSSANQTTPVNNGTFAAFDSSPAASTSVTITSNAGDLTASIGFTLNGWVSPFTNQTLTWGPDSSAAAGDRGAGTGTTTHTWADQWASQTHSVSGANFAAAP